MGSFPVLASRFTSSSPAANIAHFMGRRNRSRTAVAGKAYGFLKVGWARLKPPSSAAFRRSIRAEDGAVSNLSETLRKPYGCPRSARQIFACPG